MLGPLTFTIDRLIAIFESITETSDRSATILCQLRTLVKLKLVNVGKFNKILIYLILIVQKSSFLI